MTFTAVFLYLTTEGVKSGNIPLWATVFWIIGVLLFWWKYPMISSYCKTGNTLHEYLGNAFGSYKVRQLASCVTIVTFVAGVGLEFYGFAWIMEKLTGEQIHWILIGIVLLITMIAYTAYGGFPATVATDLFQMLIIIIGIVLLVCYGLIPEWDSVVTTKTLDVSNFFSDPLFILAYIPYSANLFATT